MSKVQEKMLEMMVAAFTRVGASYTKRTGNRYVRLPV